MWYEKNDLGVNPRVKLYNPYRVKHIYYVLQTTIPCLTNSQTYNYFEIFSCVSSLTIQQYSHISSYLYLYWYIHLYSQVQISNY